MLPRPLLALLLAALPALAAAAEGRYVFRFYCIDAAEGVLEALGRDRETNQLPAQVPMAAALALLDQDRVKLIGYARVDAVAGKEAAANNSRKAVYLELAPSGGMVQRQSEWDEGATVRVVPTVDADGRIRLDGQFALKEITARSPIVGAEKLELGRPLSHAVRTINPAVVLRAGEARLVPHIDGAAQGMERVLLVVAEAAP